jgi:hypothetical protein
LKSSDIWAKAYQKSLLPDLYGISNLFLRTTQHITEHIKN